MRKLRCDKYILDEQGRVVPEPDLMKWAKWFEHSREHRIVKQQQVEKVQVSTVFIGLDHNFGSHGPPVLWETMVFAEHEEFHGDMRRCSGTREQAEAMHQEMVEYVQTKIAQSK